MHIAFSSIWRKDNYSQTVQPFLFDLFGLFLDTLFCLNCNLGFPLVSADDVLKDITFLNGLYFPAILRNESLKNRLL